MKDRSMNKIKWKNCAGNIIDSKDNHDIIDCEVCKFKHIIPIPSESQIYEMYTEDYYKSEKQNYIKEAKKDEEWWKLSYNNRYDSFESILPSNRRKLLDIGSGPGFFLLRGKHRGWTVKGIEPSNAPYEYSKHALNLDVENIFFDKTTYKKFEKFDVINMSLVLEHIPSPKEFLKLVYNRISDGGLVSIEVPNDYNPFQKAALESLKIDPYWVAPPHHINYFNFDSLEELLKDIGFEIVLKESTFPIDIFLLMEENYIGNDLLGKRCHQMRKNFENNLYNSGLDQLKRKLYKEMATLDIGREIIMIGQKN